MTRFKRQNPGAAPVFLTVLLVLVLLGGALGAQDLPDDIDISQSPDGIVALPARVHSVFRSSFDRYTKVVAPNGGAIHFLLQSQVTNEMGVRAREILRFYITDAPGTEFGADKTAVANSMANLDATLVYFNSESAAERAIEGRLGKVDLFFQDLYASESVVEGSRDYVNNTLRDATLEEVFHLVHGAGIQPTLPAYHRQITAATNAAISAGIYDPPSTRELPRADRPFEYIISIIDVYYGMWAHDRDGDSFGGEYRYNTRAEIEAIRGVQTAKGTLDVLMEAGWIRPAGRREVPGRPLMFATTPEFLSHFALKSRRDLPGIEDLRAAGLLDPVDLAFEQLAVEKTDEDD